MNFFNKEDDKCRHPNRNYEEYFKETIKEKEDIQSNLVKIKPENKFDRSYYLNKNEDNSYMYSKV